MAAGRERIVEVVDAVGDGLDAVLLFDRGLGDTLAVPGLDLGGHRVADPAGLGRDLAGAQHVQALQGRAGGVEHRQPVGEGFEHGQAERFLRRGGNEQIHSRQHRGNVVTFPSKDHLPAHPAPGRGLLQARPLIAGFPSLAALPTTSSRVRLPSSGAAASMTRPNCLLGSRRPSTPIT